MALTVVDKNGIRTGESTAKRVDEVRLPTWPSTVRSGSRPRQPLSTSSDSRARRKWRLSARRRMTKQIYWKRHDSKLRVLLTRIESREKSRIMYTKKRVREGQR
jgi:hypothetical protein